MPPSKLIAMPGSPPRRSTYRAQRDRVVRWVVNAITVVTAVVAVLAVAASAVMMAIAKEDSPRSKPDSSSITNPTPE